MLVKIFTWIGFIFFLFSWQGFSQPRHVKGIQMGGFLIGGFSSEKTYGVVYQTFFSSNISGKCSGLYQSITKESTTYSNYILHPEFMYSVYSINNWYVNLKGGIFAGTCLTRSEIINKRNLFIGENLGITTEIYFTSRIKADVDIEQRFYQHALFGTFSPELRLSLLYTLN